MTGDACSWGGRVTVTRNVWVAVMTGVPLSLTMMRMELVAGAVVGVQLKAPVLDWPPAPAGEPLPRLKPRDCGGASGSMALAAKEMFWPRMTMRLLMADRLGGELKKILLVPGVADGRK